MNWKDTSAEKPQDHVDVLCYWADVGYDIADYESATDTWCCVNNASTECDAEPQFWMPLPPPPPSCVVED